MTKKIYAVAETVPEGCNYLTAGKRYEVLWEDDKWFDTTDDVGDLVICLWENCARLKGGNWQRIEVDEPDLIDELVAALEAISNVRVLRHYNIWQGADKCREIANEALAKYRAQKDAE